MTGASNGYSGVAGISLMNSFKQSQVAGSNPVHAIHSSTVPLHH
jgi:hypothetical protein